MDCSIYEAKRKVLVVTVQPISSFVFAYAKSRFSHDIAQFGRTYMLEADFNIMLLKLILEGY